MILIVNYYGDSELLVLRARQILRILQEDEGGSKGKQREREG